MAADAAGGTDSADLAWLLDDLASRVGDFRRAVLLSRDGLLIASSGDLTREDAEHLSAVAAALQSLASGRRSSSWRRGCCSSRPPARAVASPRCARRTRTPALSLTRWRCWSSGP